jgi:putative ABC transport system permease protein
MIFDRDNWQEIFQTIRKNKLRSFLTAFSVGWGIFILIVLLGAGQGLYNGAQSQFMVDAVNSINIQGGQTSIPYKGLKSNRNIQLTNEDYTLISQKLQFIDKKSAVFRRWGNRMISYKKNHAGFTVIPVMPEHCFLENAQITLGRFINTIDINEFRKVCVIGEPVKAELFKNENPINKFVDIEGMQYKVVGIFNDPGNGDNPRLYIPLSTAQRAYSGKRNIDLIWLSTTEEGAEKSDNMVLEIRNILSHKYNFSPQDINALRIENWGLEYKRVMSMLNGIKLFIWIIGVFTLFAGIVGVSNIMMIIVKERTKEIGIRKAIGATPSLIVGQIILEAVFITSVAGYLGLIAGVGILELVNSFNIDSDFFKNPTVDFSIAVYATLLIILAGALAGFIPSIRAAKVEPVVALRSE